MKADTGLSGLSGSVGGLSVTAALEAAIGLSGYLWIDNGKELEDGQPAGDWTDLIQGLVATQAIGDDKPVARHNQLTGRLEIVLDGTDFLQTAAFGSALSQPTTIYVVMRDSVGADAALRTVVTGIHTDNRHTIVSDTIWKLTSGAAAISFSAAPADTVPHLVVSEFNDGAGDANNTNLYIDGVLISRPHGNSGPDTLTGITIGANAAGGSNFEGAISAIVVKSGLRSVAVETELTTYLQLGRYLNNEVTNVIEAVGPTGFLWVDDGNGELVDTENVPVWTDLVQGVEATQGTESKQPTAQLNVAAGFQELVFVRGDSSSLQTTAFASALAQPTTLYVVLEIAYDEGSKHLQRDIFDGRDGSNNFIFATQSTVLKMRSGVTWISYSAFIEDVVQILTTEYNQPTSKLYVDGADSGFSGNTGTNVLAGLTMGGNNTQNAVFWDGQLLAIAIKPGVRDAAIEVALNDYLNNPVTLP